MRIRTKELLGWLLPILLLAACKDQEEAIPAYLKIEQFSINSPGSNGGHKITEGWLYVNDVFLGAYSLPALVPVLAEGQSTIQVFPGVKENGQTLTPGLYPLLDRFETTAVLTPAETTTIQPLTRYATSAIFPWSLERAAFDNSSIVLENRDGDSTTSFVVTTMGAFEGNSVLMQVDTAHQIIEIATELVSNLPTTGDRPVWLELHYQNNMPFEFWILGADASGNNEVAQPVFQFAPSEDWNKIYFNLTNFLVNLQQVKHRLFFRVKLPLNSSGTPAQDSGAVYLDNIRLIHF